MHYFGCSGLREDGDALGGSKRYTLHLRTHRQSMVHVAHDLRRATSPCQANAEPSRAGTHLRARTDRSRPSPGTCFPQQHESRQLRQSTRRVRKARRHAPAFARVRAAESQSVPCPRWTTSGRAGRDRCSSTEAAVSSGGSAHIPPLPRTNRRAEGAAVIVAHQRARPVGFGR